MFLLRLPVFRCSQRGGVASHPDGAHKSKLSGLKTTVAITGNEGPLRGSLFTSILLSPISYPDLAAAANGHDFPFSIELPPSPSPPTHLLNVQLLTVPFFPHNQLRSDSISSVSMGGSANSPRLGLSGAAAGNGSFGSGGMTKPAAPNVTPAVAIFLAPEEDSPLRAAVGSLLRICRSRVPTDIDIRSISPHAQAERLVQRA
jgi:hypothetical protein